MSKGLYISSGLHVGLIGWMLLGWGLASEPLDFDAIEVTMISADAFDAALAAGQPEVAPAPQEVPQPVPVPVSRPEPAVVPQPEPDAPTPPPPADVTPPQPDPVPEPLAPAPRADVTDVPPDAPVAPVATPDVDVDRSVAPPKPRPSDRIAPITVAPPEQDVAVGEVEVAPTAPGDAPTAPAPTPAAPEAASNEIVTEAERPAGQSTRAVVPPSRPRRVAEAPAEQADPAPATEPQTETAPETVAETAPEVDPVAAALAAAMAASETPAQGQQGQALTQGELGSFLGQIAACWNMAATSTDAQLTKVVLYFELTQDGRLRPGSIERRGFTGGDARAADIAYRSAERALQQCETTGGRAGYRLPPEKYDQWKEVELRFDPQTMRLR